MLNFRLTAFLDLDKLIEHRPPLDNMSIWKRPAVPQRKVFPELLTRT